VHGEGSACHPKGILAQQASIPTPFLPPFLPPAFVQYLQGQGSTPDIHITDLAGKWQTHMRSALLHRYGVTAQELVDVRGGWEGGKEGGREGGRKGGKKGYSFYAGTSMWSLSPYQWL